MSLTVPFRTQKHVRPDEDDAAAAVPPGERVAGAEARPVRPAPVTVGAVELRSVAAYLAVWTVVLFAVEVLVLWAGHTALLRLGVLASVSEAVATVLGDPVPETGVLPALEFDALLPWLLVGAAALAVLWLLTLLGLVLVHNAVCAVTGGPRVRVR